MKDPDNFADADRIDIENDYELQYWTSELKATNDKLKAAVTEVGKDIHAVKVYLNKA